jgi:hypothetical protein
VSISLAETAMSRYTNGLKEKMAQQLGACALVKMWEAFMARNQKVKSRLRSPHKE